MSTKVRCMSLAALLIMSMSTRARGDDVERQRLSHDRAIDAVTEVVAEVLQLQLRKLEVNGLQEQPIYRELQASRTNLRGLVKSEMSELRKLLADSDSPNEIASDVRQLARRIVVKLTAERLRVQKRRSDVGEATKPDFDPELLAKQTNDLQELGETLDQLLEKQARAKEMAAADAEAARKLEESIGAELEKAAEDSDLDDQVETRLDEAQDAVADAEKQLQEDSDASATDRMQAIEAAEDALMQASVEVESQLNDLKQALDSETASQNAAPSDGVSKNEPSSGTTRDLGSGAASGGDRVIEARSLTGETWFARLPAELQAAIRAQTRRPAPRGYEERLGEYFRSTD